MIVVVEGPAGSGKTTWRVRHGGARALLETLPDHATVPTDTEAEARFWVDRNVARRNEVLERERRDGLVIVHTDPFKLYFVWTLWKSGRASESSWTMQRDVAREAFAAGRYALADVCDRSYPLGRARAARFRGSGDVVQRTPATQSISTRIPGSAILHSIVERAGGALEKNSR